MRLPRSRSARRRRRRALLVLAGVAGVAAVAWVSAGRAGGQAPAASGGPHRPGVTSVLAASGGAQVVSRSSSVSPADRAAASSRPFGHQLGRQLGQGVLALAAGLSGAAVALGAVAWSRRRRVRPAPTPTVGLRDVAGLDDAMEEVSELARLLRSPERASAAGGRLPRGVLLVGPPGTGKTLLAQVLAGAAGVPFFALAGSEFVETYAGVGAARLRAVFARARAAAPAVVFLDELDALGRRRGGTDELASEVDRDQALNQLLVEMDGVGRSGGVVVVAATNRPDVLDPALLRAGRFDRRIVLEVPDRRARLAILSLYGGRLELARSVDLADVARRTAGLVGADLENLLNEAALLAGRAGRRVVVPADVEEALDRVVAGVARPGRASSGRGRFIVAAHEAGHAVVADFVGGEGAVERVSLLPRGSSLGWTLAPDEDQAVATRSRLLDRLAVLLGGRAGEEVLLGEPSSGAADDLAQARRLARAMAAEHGMVDTLRFGADAGAGDRVAAAADKILEEAWRRAVVCLEARRRCLEDVALALVAEETLAGPRLAALLRGARSRRVAAADGGRSRPEWSTVPAGGRRRARPVAPGRGGGAATRPLAPAHTLGPGLRPNAPDPLLVDPLVAGSRGA